MDRFNDVGGKRVCYSSKSRKNIGIQLFHSQGVLTL